MLAIQKYLHEHGLEKTLADFKLKHRHYGHKVLIKYDQIESNFSHEEVRDCRGLILENKTWKVMSLAFRKFFNAEEGHAAKLDWNKARVFEKVDGTLIQLYYDWVVKRWYAGTTGTAEAEGDVNGGAITFAELFLKTIRGKVGEFSLTGENELIIPGHTYAFELTTPWNIVVCPHGTSDVTLLGVRELESMDEMDYGHIVATSKNLGVTVVKSFPLKADYATLRKTFENMKYSEEGYVVWDGKERNKIKNPAYVAAHHLKSSMAEYKIMTIIKTNEVDEFIASFPERRVEILKARTTFNAFKIKLESVWEVLKDRLPKNITKEENKRYAMEVFKACELYDVKGFTGLYFSLKDKKVESVTGFLMDYNDKHLYEICSK